MYYWIWLTLGIGLMALELFAPAGFYLFILGASCILVGLCVAASLLSSWVAQASAFCVIAIALWCTLGEKLRTMFVKRSAHAGQVNGQVVRVTQEIRPGGVGSGELWGSSWRLENVDSSPLLAGSEAVVIGAEGVTLKVKRHKV